ncbi:MAG TPA: DUF1207 domain-containing protein [Thermoguttaceae bacterium]|nr:DUF1207 domain-containing protein [Thermoguttaceae bacterium]
MSRHQALFLAAAFSPWLVVSLGTARVPAQVQAQVHAMPPTTAWGPAGPTGLPGTPGSTAFVPLPGDGVENAFDGNRMDMGLGPGQPAYFDGYWTWQTLPDGFLYPAYMAGGRESRFASHWMCEKDKGWLWDIALGGHVGMLRYGNSDPIRPEGWQVDVEGAAFPRLTLGSVRDLTSVDFRFGLPLTFRRGPWETKFGYYHLSSHLGDEYMVTQGTLDRLNYTRDVLIAGLAFRPHRDLRLYAEAGWAFYTDGGSQPWEFQFGIDYSPVEPWSALGTPFFAVNTRIREEVDFGGNVTVQTGLQWRGGRGQLFRFGLHYFNGKSDQYQFFTEHEEQIGLGVWYDF